MYVPASSVSPPGIMESPPQAGQLWNIPSQIL